MNPDLLCVCLILRDEKIKIETLCTGKLFCLLMSAQMAPRAFCKCKWKITALIIFCLLKIVKKYSEHLLHIGNG